MAKGIPGLQDFDFKLSSYFLSFVDDETLSTFLCLSKKWRLLAGTVELWQPHFHAIQEQNIGLPSEEQLTELQFGSIQLLHFMPLLAKKKRRIRRRKKHAEKEQALHKWVGQHRRLFGFAVEALQMAGLFFISFLFSFLDSPAFEIGLPRKVQLDRYILSFVAI
jgi:hypothetical protein